MARVSQEHLDARRRQILDGAARCFARSGFHGTSMQDVLKEVGLSAGAVYRYFPGKEDIIAAITEETFATIRGAFEEASRMSPPPTPDVLLSRVLGRVLSGEVHGLERRTFAALAVQLWSETLRDERLAVQLDEGYATMRAAWTKLVEAYRGAGLLGGDVAADHVARTMIAAAQGFIVQEALFGDVHPEVLENGLRGLMSMGPQKAS
ncbi:MULTISPECIES: TetR/AcrR family transcriptional regulator [Streptomyces]|uniref:TetR/AcrR family transcriptional regulator n=1 Tax=Streptomyces cyaneofuscatus TaxID=66883 RepID=A0ABZ1EQF4_9ACTN|nr:TetR/AcrR family transcriptional regulator [Streptomyces cyaneofuscatus]WSB06350.1 TetR/AcrR family transcriptional regulator [Streptomyces cyaneofuscatus]WSD50115.1 TetR/AcrR family transcriptional regulator [Streptomyces cyaneofuscatus]WTA93535.1 TetR/AcrR family transcriptional regulator [Streptomyces cyaneofuscatus]